MANFYEYFIKWALVGLVFVSLFAWIIGVQDENDASEKIVNERLINNTFSGIRSDLISYREDAQTQKGLFETETPTQGFGSILLYSVVSAGKVFNGMTIGLFNSMIQLPVVYLGLDPVTASVISIIIIVTIIITLWILYKLGG